MSELATVDVSLDIDVNLTNSFIDSVHVNQYENNARSIKCSLFNGGTKYSIPSNYGVNIRVERPNGTGAWVTLANWGGELSSDRSTITIPVLNDNTETVDIKGNTVEKGLTAVAGKNIVQFEFVKSTNEEVILTNVFYLYVHKSAMDNSDLNAENEYQILDSYADLSKSWAVGGTGSRSGEDENNSYYYSERSRIYMDTKAEQSTVNECIKQIDFNESNGQFTITFVNGTTKVIDTNIEKIAVNFAYDSINEKLILYDANEQVIAEIDLSVLIRPTEFVDSNTISFTTVKKNEYKFDIIAGSITEDLLDYNYKSELDELANKAQTNAENAESWANTTSDYKDECEEIRNESANILASCESCFEGSELASAYSQSYAVGGTNTRAGEDTDNAKYYYEQVKVAKRVLDSGLVYMGVIAFGGLPFDAHIGDWYIIEDSFTSDNRFIGEITNYPSNTNVYCIGNNIWCAIGGSSGSKEIYYINQGESTSTLPVGSTYFETYN